MNIYQYFVLEHREDDAPEGPFEKFTQADDRAREINGLVVQYEFEYTDQSLVSDYTTDASGYDENGFQN